MSGYSNGSMRLLSWAGGVRFCLSPRCERVVTMLASADSFAWMDVVFACLMLSFGFVVGWCVTRTLSTQPAETQRAQKALHSLRQLASSVAEDVGQHASRVQ